MFMDFFFFFVVGNFFHINLLLLLSHPYLFACLAARLASAPGLAKPRCGGVRILRASLDLLRTTLE